MKQHITLGVVSLARTTFDYIAAQELYNDILVELKHLEEVSLIPIETQIIEVEDAKKAGSFFLSKEIDALVVISGTFHLGHLVLELDKMLHVPILLWGSPNFPIMEEKSDLTLCVVSI